MGREPQVVVRAAISFLLIASVAGCGQKSGVADLPSGDGFSSISPGDPDALDFGAEGNGGPSQYPWATVSTGSEADTRTLGSGGSVYRASAPEGSSLPPGETMLRSPRPPTGGDTTGVTGSTIKIGLHIPVTQGPPNSTASARIYWRQKTIEGRRVELVVVDDGYSPGKAHDACRELIEVERVFAIVGFAGPYQIQACARVASAAGVPYLVLGSSEALLRGLATHFSISMPYPRQAGLVADLLVNELDGLHKRNGFLRVAGGVPAESQRYADEIEARGARFHAALRLTPDAAYQDWEQAAIHFKQRAINNIVFGAGPLQFSYFVTAAARHGYFPRLIGPGFTVTIDEFLRVTCQMNRAGHGALFFSPFPAFEGHHRWDSDFHAAGGSNDIDWIFWSLSKAIHKLMALPGRDLTRERLLWFVARARGLRTGIMPPISFANNEHFSGHSMHLLRANCVKQSWETYRTFVKP